MSRNALCGFFAVAGEHNSLFCAALLQAFNGFCGIRLNNVGNNYAAGVFSVNGSINNRSLVVLLPDRNALSIHQPDIAGKDLLSVNNRRNTAARNFMNIRNPFPVRLRCTGLFQAFAYGMA